MKINLKGTILILVLLLLWQAGVQSGLLNHFIIASPVEVLRSIYRMLETGALIQDICASLKRVFVGFIISIIIGVPLGLFLGRSRELKPYFLPVLEVLRPIPPIAWIPLAILWFGLRDTSSYFITMIASFFPIFLNSFAGAENVEPVHINAALSLGANKQGILKKILLPSALPFIFTGIRVGLGVAWMSVIAAEMIAARSGLGYMIQLNRMMLETQNVIAGMIFIGLLGFLMNYLLLKFQKKLIPWKQL
ncbi:MAG: ABC transporter permease [Elusimicrobia bacterium]|nr:ABC transporter permease [Candidatus Liberimonas magnetica]